MPLPKFAAWFIEKIRGKPAAPPTDSTFVPASSAKRAKKGKANSARDLILSGKAPEDFSAPFVDLEGVTEPFVLPARLQCFDLRLGGSTVTHLPDGIQVGHRIDLSDCTALNRLPDRLQTGSLILKDCRSLAALPENSHFHFLVLDGCSALRIWPLTARVTFGRVSAKRCTGLTAIPAALGPITALDLNGCSAMQSLPDIQVTSWIDIKGTGIRTLPESLRDVDLR